MKHGRPQAKDISDAAFFAELDRVTKPWGVAFWYDLELGVPPKVVLAKGASMRKRGLIEGCCCGCRGDWKRAKPKP